MSMMTMQVNHAHAILDEELNLIVLICNSLRVSAGFVLNQDLFSVFKNES